MPKIKNRKTGKEYQVTSAELARLRASTYAFHNVYQVTQSRKPAEVPEEVKALQEAKAEVKVEATEAEPRAKAKKAEKAKQ